MLNRRQEMTRDDRMLIEDEPSSTISFDYYDQSYQPGKIEKSSDKRFQQGLTLGFSDIHYSVYHGIKRVMKKILKGISGEFRAGEITAIIGPSGAGKSSLMNILAGFTTTGLLGKVTVNEKCRDMRTFSRNSCYIFQDDVLPNYLTVYEAMIAAAILKLGPNFRDFSQQIWEILENLNLKHHQDVMTCSLSGGQKKRLAIALELISNPPIMFFDEPTSGLDSSTSKQCISVLRRLAEDGRTIVCTIHQPSASIFELFNHIYVVCDGYCMYSGSTSQLVGFLANSGLNCPHYNNPADFILEECKDHLPRLVKAIESGKNMSWRTNDSNDNSLNRLKKRFAGEQQQVACGKNRSSYSSNFRTQFSTLLLRNFKRIYREHVFAQLRLYIHILVGLLIGTLFYDIGNDAAHVIDNFNVLFFSIMFTMFTSYSSAVTYFPQQLPILVRENFNKWYSVKSYFLASNLSETPVQILCTYFYFTIVYFLTSQPGEWERYFYSTGTILIVALVAQSFGYLIGSSMPIANAAIFGPLITSPFILFSGFFVLVTDAPLYLRWLFSLSYFKYALHAIVVFIFGFNRTKLNCSEDFCRTRSPQKFLRDIGMADGSVWIDWGFLICLIIFLRICAFYALTIKLKYTR